jgi:hypothetical protein
MSSTEHPRSHRQSREAAAARTGSLALWAIAETFLTTLFALFGAPEEIAARHTLAARPRALLLAWLRAGEALMRRLLLIEAAAYAKPNTRAILWPKRTRTRRLMGFDAEHPEAWRVSFRCFAGDTHARAARRSAWLAARRACVSPTAPRFYSAWPIAERAEALLRVFNAPAAFAARLARRLFATPHRAPALLAHPPDAPDLIGREAFAALGAAAKAARRDSS